MKLKVLSIAVLGLIFVASCNKLKSLVNIEQDLPFNQSFSLQAAAINDTAVTNHFPAAGIHYSSANIPVPTNQQQTLSNYKTAANLINSFYIKSLNLSLTPATATFNSMDTVNIFICKTVNDSMIIAHKYGVNTTNSIAMDVDTTINLKDYFLNSTDTFYFKFSGHFKSVPTDSIGQMNINSVMHLSANPLN
jgi:hypothetical protein